MSACTPSYAMARFYTTFFLFFCRGQKVSVLVPTLFGGFHQRNVDVVGFVGRSSAVARNCASHVLQFACDDIFLVLAHQHYAARKHNATNTPNTYKNSNRVDSQTTSVVSLW